MFHADGLSEVFLHVLHRIGPEIFMESGSSRGPEIFLEFTVGQGHLREMKYSVKSDYEV